MNIGLLLFGLIQLATAVTMFFQKPGAVVMGMATLPKEMRLYRHMLAGLWITIGGFVLTSAFYRDWWQAASLLAGINALMESLGYWSAYSRKEMPLWYATTGTTVMLGAAGWGLAVAWG